jgi:hypothetical protein
LACGHFIICDGCAGEKVLDCGKCGCDQVFSGKLLIAEAYLTNSSIKQPNQSNSKPNQLTLESLKPNYLKYIYKTLLNSFEDRQEFLNLVQNLLYSPKCFKCQDKEILYFSFRDQKGFCSSCRNHSSIHINSPVFQSFIKKYREQVSTTLSPFMHSNLEKILKIEINPLKILSHLLIFLKFGLKVDGFTKICASCFCKFDYKVRIPLIYNCRYELKHVICTQCFFSASGRCPFDDFEMKNIRVFYENTRKVECFNKCGYFGALYHRYNFTQYICEKCYRSTMFVKEPEVCVKQCLMFFKLLCLKHRRISNFFDKSKFEALCYNCCDDSFPETSTEQIFQLLAEKEKWIIQERLPFLTTDQQKKVKEMNLGKFLSLGKRYEQIKQLEMILNEFWFNEPLLLNSYKQINLILNEGKKYYSEMIEFKVDSRCMLAGVILEKYPEIDSFCVDLLQDREYVYRIYKNFENNNQQEFVKVFFDEEMYVEQGVNYLLHVSFHVINDFIFYKRVKKAKENELTQNGISLSFKITSTHERKVLVHGLILIAN